MIGTMGWLLEGGRGLIACGVNHLGGYVEVYAPGAVQWNAVHLRGASRQTRCTSEERRGERVRKNVGWIRPVGRVTFVASSMNLAARQRGAAVSRDTTFLQRDPHRTTDR